MKIGKYVSIFMLSTALNVQATGSFTAAAERKTPQPRLEKQRVTPEKKSKENADAEWFADPERGWVRVDGRPGPNDDQKKTQQAAGKPKSKTPETVKQ